MSAHTTHLHYVSIGITSNGDEPIADLLAAVFGQARTAVDSGRNLEVNEEKPTSHVRVRVIHEREADAKPAPTRRRRKP